MVDGNEVNELLESAVEQLGNRHWVVSDILFLHELQLRILNQLSETNHQAPRIRSASLKPLQENLRDLLKNYFFASLGVNRQYGARKVKSVLGWVPELVDDGVEEAESGLIVESLHYLFEGVSRGPLPLVGVAALLVRQVKHHR